MMELISLGMLTKSLQPTGSNVQAVQMWSMDSLWIQHPVSFKGFIILELTQSTSGSHALMNDVPVMVALSPHSLV